MIRFSIPILLMLGAGVLIQTRASQENLPKSQPLSFFPLELGVWRGRDIQLQQSVLDLLGPGQFLSRIYVNSSSANSPYIDLFIGYFPSQKTGNTAHSPRNCLPGSGWYFADIRRQEISLAGRTLSVNRAIIQKGTDRQLMYYWYQSHGRTVASEYAAKYYLIADAIRLNRTDGSIVRVITPIENTEEVRTADARATQFLGGVVPELPYFIPN